MLVSTNKLYARKLDYQIGKKVTTSWKLRHKVDRCRGRHFSAGDDNAIKIFITATRPVATEEQLSADFRKKLAEWQRIKGERQPPPAPARKDLSEDFLKKWGKVETFLQLNQHFQI